MNFLELAKSRFSERFFSDKQIEKEKSKPNLWHFKRNDISEFVKYF